MCQNATQTLKANNGDTLVSPMTNAAAIAQFLTAYPNAGDSWLWYHIHKAVITKPSRAALAALDFLRDTFVLAVGYGLKRPMIRLHYKNQRFKLYLSAKGTVCIKSGFLAADGSKDPEGDEFYIGCLYAGKFLPAKNDYSKKVRESTATEKEFLENLNDDPIGFLSTCSKDLNRCCYCNQPLEDARSKAVGYGETCAAHWGLPWGEADYVEKAPSFSKVYADGAGTVCKAVRQNPTSEVAWGNLATWLATKGLPIVKKPGSGVTVPGAN